jgi:hypothetical protein
VHYVNLAFAPAASGRPVKVSVDMRQFSVIVSALHKDAPAARVAAMFRDGFDSSAGGVTMQKFFDVAERCVLTAWSGGGGFD